MATRAASIQAILEFIADVGLSPECAVDTDESPGPFTLTGWDEKLQGTVKVGPTALDQALTFTDALAIVLVSDQPFDMRLAAGETLLTNQRMFIVWADDTDDGVHQTSVLLTGNTIAQAIVSYFIIEAP